LAGATRSAQAGFNKGDLAAINFPLPPLAEQNRIVAKVDELMALCNRLEAARADREATRDRLTAASLARLNAPDTETFREDARFVLEALSALTARADQINQLRQGILNLAVRGSLVTQDFDDQPASELLKRIAIEKARLVKTRHSVGVRDNKDRELIFPIPSHWCPASLRDVLHELQTGPFGSSLHQSDYRIGGTPVINPASIQDGKVVPIAKMAVAPATLERLWSFRLRAGDIVMARRGEMGRCALVTDREVGWLCGTGSLILRPSPLMFGPFLVLLIGSPFGREYLRGSAVGATMQNLNQSILLKLSFGLPPFPEQRRIVARVDELMALCDQLEASLTGADDTRRRLLEALLAEVFAPDDGRELEAAE
jgi:type I restriction enzyme S subunit